MATLPLGWWPLLQSAFQLKTKSYVLLFLVLFLMVLEGLCKGVGTPVCDTLASQESSAGFFVVVVVTGLSGI